MARSDSSAQELGRPAGQHLRESEEAVAVMKRVMTVEQRVSAYEEQSKKCKGLIDGNI
jgi:hypothetical protein